MKKLKKLKKLKKEIVNEILNDTTLSKVEKLSKITQHDLWDYNSYITDIFHEWEQECIAEEERLAIEDGKIKGTDYISTITDATLYEDYSKYEIVYYSDLIERILLDYTEEEIDNKVLVAKCRGSYNARIYKTYEEVIDYIYDYSIKNKSIGFKMDW